jgi:hypothetical protein
LLHSGYIRLIQPVPVSSFFRPFAEQFAGAG